MAATAKPRATNAPAERDGSPSLLPIRNAPPWIDTTSGQRGAGRRQVQVELLALVAARDVGEVLQDLRALGQGHAGRRAGPPQRSAPTDRSRNDSIVRMGAS